MLPLFDKVELFVVARFESESIAPAADAMDAIDATSPVPAISSDIEGLQFSALETLLSSVFEHDFSSLSSSNSMSTLD